MPRTPSPTARVDLSLLRESFASHSAESTSPDTIDAELTIQLTAIALAESRGFTALVDERADPLLGTTDTPTVDLTADVRSALEPIAELAWIVGAWSATVDGTTTTETWCPSPAADRTSPATEGPRPAAEQELGGWIGDNRTRNGAREVAFEWVAIEGHGAAAAYLAQPSGRTPPTRFDRVAFDHPRAAAFENPTHDSPQRLEYLREGPLLRATASNADAQLPFAWTRAMDGVAIVDRDRGIAAVPALARARAAIRERAAG